MKNERDDCITDKLYERDAYIKSFAATVLSCEKVEDGYGIILDITAFFPEGGGQSCDTGLIDGIEVYNVQTVNGEIVHYAKEAIEKGKEVFCEIDFDKRFRKMQNHSGEHLLCGIIHNIYGFDNVGFHMDEYEVTLDVNGKLDNEMLLEIERKANQAIYENVKITVSFPDSNEAKNIDYRSKLDIEEGVRLVTIEGYDICACCAPHLSMTGEIGIIKIIDSFFHRGGTRITMRAGLSAYEDYLLLDKNNKGLVALLSSKRYDTYDYAMRSDERYHALLEENIRLKKMFADQEAKKLLEEIENNSAIEIKLIFSEVLDQVQMRNIINTVTEKYSMIVAAFIGNDMKGYDYIIGRGKDNETNLSILAKELNEKFNGRGGGKPVMVQGHINAAKEEILNYNFLK